MKINIEYPFTDNFKSAYLLINNEGRRVVVLYKNVKERTTIQYAKYVMSIKIGRILSRNEQVDHIDGNKTNDDISNLQILTPEAHRRKTYHGKHDKLSKYICPECGKSFVIKYRNSNMVPSKSKEYKFCSRNCLYNGSSNVKNRNYNKNTSYLVDVYYK